MSIFTDFEAFSRVPNTHKTYVTETGLMWEIGNKGSGWFLNIPAKTKFDLSVPRWLEWALSPHNRQVLLAALVHDELLKKGHDVGFASAEFRRAAIARGASSWLAWTLFFTTLVWTAATHKRTPDNV